MASRVNSEYWAVQKGHMSPGGRDLPDWPDDPAFDRMWEASGINPRDTGRVIEFVDFYNRFIAGDEVPF